MNTLLFIDSNIFLDFYRVGNEIRPEFLNTIDKNKEKIIITRQVEMEFKKNRQTVILGSAKNFKNPNWNSLTIPKFASNSKASEEIQKYKQQILKQQKIIEKNIKDILENPLSKDKGFSEYVCGVG